mgnify:CR=1 FL=1
MAAFFGLEPGLRRSRWGALRCETGLDDWSDLHEICFVLRCGVPLQVVADVSEGTKLVPKCNICWARFCLHSKACKLLR